jgi:hypothetical protein
MKSEIIHKDPNELGFILRLGVQNVRLRIWKSTEIAHLDLE